MIKDIPPKIEQGFQDNLRDWCLGGPKEGGWTRRGMRTTLPPVRLTGFQREEFPIIESLGKNRAETKRWHIAYLKTLVDVGKSRFYWKNTSYYWEYLKPRYNDEDGRIRAMSFIDLFEDVLDNGIRKPIMVADLEDLDLKFRYFRFDGCHRVCSALVAGYEMIPTLVFKVERCVSNDLSELRMSPISYNRQKHVNSLAQQRYLL